MKTSLLKAINNIKDVKELNEAIELIKLKQKQLRREANQKAKASVDVGSRVKVSTRDDVVNGVIVEIRRTKAVVTIPNFKGRANGRWTVGLSQLKAA
jgi:hypothetical protein